jgi:hypothetical protein
MNTHYANMYATALTEEQHERTCNYWYTVTCGATAHTAFTTHRGLERWLEERGLTLDGEMPETRGEWATMRVIGEYRHQSHGEFSPTEADPYRMVAGDEMGAIVPVVTTAAMSNGDYTLALIDEDGDGVRTVHTLNPNVKTRIVYDHAATREEMS